MTREERRSKLESFGHAPTLLAGALRQFPKKMWLYKPSAEKWSIHETILHLADSEASGYVRCRRFIAEPGSPVLQFDAARWAGSLGYFHQSTREALEIIRRLRKMTYQLLASLPDPIWSNAVEQPDDGLLRPGGLGGYPGAPYPAPHRANEAKLRSLAESKSTQEACFSLGEIERRRVSANDHAFCRTLSRVAAPRPLD